MKKIIEKIIYCKSIAVEFGFAGSVFLTLYALNIININ